MNPHDLTGRFAARLREIRESRGLSQEALADAAGIHRTHVSLIERNRRSVRLDTLFRLASALEIDPADLVRGLVDAPSRPEVSVTSEFDRLFPFVRRFHALATRHGIQDIFQDNGGKLLQALLVLGLHRLERREGNDAVDDRGQEYELKTLNVRLKKSFSTHHHLNLIILQKYRSVTAWYFSLYQDIELQAIYRVAPHQLEQRYFQRWEDQLRRRRTGGHLNNPTISVTFVRQVGTLVYPAPSRDVPGT
jgi:transcriptional regulator with XRE-family HTH domain